MKLFTVLCCGKRRGLIKGILVCGKCDYDHDRATVIPNEQYAKDVPSDSKVWAPGMEAR